MHTYTRHHRHYNTPILSGWVLKLWQKPRGLRKRYLPAQILFLTSYQTHKKNGRTYYLSHPSSRAECTRAELFSQLRTVARVRPHRLDTKKKFISFWQTTVRRTLLSHSRKSAHPNILSSSFSGINQLCRVNFILAGLCFLFTVNVQSQKRRSSTELESVVNWKTEPVACVCVAASVFFLYLAWCLHTCWIQIAELFVSEKPHQKETRTRRQQQQQNLAIAKHYCPSGYKSVPSRKYSWEGKMQEHHPPFHLRGLIMLLAICLSSIGVTRVQGHGRLVEPPSRSSAWR
jgi:hypothetical protein